MPKRNYNYDELAALEAGLQALRRYNRVMLISGDEEHLSNPIIEKYILAERNSAEEKEYARLAIQAMKDFYLSHPDIPKRNRARCAERGGKEFFQVLEGAKVDVLYETGKLGVGTKAIEKRQQLQEENSIVAKAAQLQKMKDRIKRLPRRITIRQGVKLLGASISSTAVWSATSSSLTSIAAALGLGASAAAAVPAIAATAAVGVTCIAVDVAVSLIPKSVKKKIKDKGHELMQKASDTVEKAVRRFESTPTGQKVKKVIETHVEPVVKKGVEVIKNTYEKVKEKAKSMWTGLKSWFA